MLQELGYAWLGSEVANIGQNQALDNLEMRSIHNDIEVAKLKQQNVVLMRALAASSPEAKAVIENEMMFAYQAQQYQMQQARAQAQAQKEQEQARKAFVEANKWQIAGFGKWEVALMVVAAYGAFFLIYHAILYLFS